MKNSCVSRAFLLCGLHDRKPQTSEKIQECKQPPKKSGRHHEGPSHPMSDGGNVSGEKVKESGPEVTVMETIPSSSDAVQCYQSPPACIGDCHKRSTMVSWESQGNTCLSRWNFTTISFPNMGADCPQALLSEPDKRFLPKNVTARAIDATRWRNKLNQKCEKLSRKEREHLEWERRYKSSINEDKEVRQCSTWQEYKALLEKRRQQKEKRYPANLWQQAITPLVKPDQGLSTGTLCVYVYWVYMYIQTYFATKVQPLYTDPLLFQTKKRVPAIME